MPNFSIKVKVGKLTSQNVDLLVNSANTYLLLGSGTAEQIRETGGYYSPTDKEFKEYWGLVDEANPTLKKVLDYIHSKRPKPSIVQKECLDYIIKENDLKELSLGDSVLTTSGNLSKVPNKAKHIVHAVGMTYDWKVQPNPPIIPATFMSVRESLIKSFDIASEIKCESLALPVMCTRKGGLTKEESSWATLQALEELNSKDTSIKSVSIVLYSEELKKEKEWFRSFYNVW